MTLRLMHYCTSEHQSSSSRRYRGWVLLLVCLAGLVGWGGFLAVRAPYHDDDSYLSFYVLPERSLALMHQSREPDTMNSVITWSKTAVLDLDSGNTWTLHNQRFAVLVHVGDDGKTHWFTAQGHAGIWDVKQQRDLEYLVTDFATGRVLKSLPYHFEFGSYRTVIQERFIVTKRENAIEVIDLDALPPTPNSFPTSNPNRLIESAGDSGSFVVFGNTGSLAQPFELFHVDADGQVSSIASWSAMPLGRADYRWPGFSGGEIATIGVNGKQIEVHSAADGSLRRTVLLPADFDPKKLGWRCSAELLFYLDNKTLKVFDWRVGKSLPGIEDSDEHWRHDGSLIVVRSASSNGERRVINVRTGEQIGRFQSLEGLSYFDGERAIVTSQKQGWTITEFDLASGKVARQWQPFAYVGPSLVGWLVAFSAWCLAWMSVSARQGSRAWIDVLLLGGVAFGLLTFRAVVAGDTLDADRHVYQYAQGIAMAGATVALLWLVFGRTRITLRVLPLIGFCAFITALLARLFGEQPTTAWYALGSTFLPVLVLSVWLLMLRILKWQLVISGEHTATGEPTRYPLRDLFWITLLMSAGFAALRLISGEAGVLLDLQPINWALLISQVVGMVAIIGVLSRHRPVFAVCAVTVVAAFVYLTVEPVARYGSGRLYDIYPLLPTDIPQRILTTFPVAVFVLLLPYRLRGWRLRPLLRNLCHPLP